MPEPSIFADFDPAALLGPEGMRAALLLLLGLPLARAVSSGVGALVGRVFSESAALPSKRITWYLGLGAVVASLLRELGFDLGVLMGAAGVLTVAIGFASQTSAANLISGLFLMADRSFGVGDILDVEGTQGEVISIDLLSVKLRTFDNLMVRVPNEALVKARFTNLTRYPLRRLDLSFALPHDADLDAARAALLKAPEIDPLSLEEPPPELRITGLSDRGVELTLIVWVATPNVLAVRTRTWAEVKAALDRLGIEPGAPRRRVELSDKPAEGVEG